MAVMPRGMNMMQGMTWSWDLQREGGKRATALRLSLDYSDLCTDTVMNEAQKLLNEVANKIDKITVDKN